MYICIDLILSSYMPIFIFNNFDHYICIEKAFHTNNKLLLDMSILTILYNLTVSSSKINLNLFDYLIIILFGH